MGGISSRIARQYYRFNAENRAHRIIKSKEIRPAPKHETTLKHIDTLEKEMPNLKDELAKFDPNLHDRLKHVYVTSEDVQPVQNVFRKPPQLSHSVRRTADFGFDENEKASPGRITLKHAVQMIMTHYHSEDSKVDDRATQYDIKKKDAENILKYYQCFGLKLPRGEFPTEKYINTIMFGNETGEIISSQQFIKRIKDQKGVRDTLTKGIPPLNQDLIEWDEEEDRKRALPSGPLKKPADAIAPESEESPKTKEMLENKKPPEKK